MRVLRKPLPPAVADAIFEAAQVANALHLAGVVHRVTGPANAALQTWTLAYRNSWSMIPHNDNMALMHQVALGIAPSADALSVDAWLRDRTLLPDRAGRAYGGAATLMTIGTAAVYLISGVAKVRSPLGWRWAGGRVLREQIAADAVRKEVFGSRAPEAAGRLCRASAPFGVLSAGVLAIELGAPIALLGRRPGIAVAAAAWAMHHGIRRIMGIRFPYNLSGIPYLPMILR
ncbi:hypothetical protein [Corynebacterium sp. 335C]